MKDLREHSRRIPTLKYIKYDLPAGLVVFLVALPLCLGIALASGAPLYSGLITGMVGGLLVSVLSGSQLSVSGPAAGLTTVIISAMAAIGYEGLLFAIIVAGVFQIILGFLKAGMIANFFPTCVIRGMLAAIGVILILKQLPHAFGYHGNFLGDFSFMQLDKENSFSALKNLYSNSTPAAVIICLVSLTILILWQRPFMERFRVVPAPLVVVAMGILINQVFIRVGSPLALTGHYLVNIPVAKNVNEFVSLFHSPNFTLYSDMRIYQFGITIALVASIESLLSLEAIDKLDPFKRVSSPDTELKAQGIGNIISGLLGGLPMTAVIVRGSANINGGGKTKTASFFHGVFLLLTVVFIPGIINLIPLAALASILIITGYNLTNLPLYKSIYKLGWPQFFPFIVTLLAIVLTDLLIGISIGMAVGIFFILRENMRNSYSFKKGNYLKGEPIRIILSEEVSFLNKAAILITLKRLPEDCKVIIDGSHSHYIDYDILEIINNFKENAVHRDIEVELIGIKEVYVLKGH